MAKGRNARDSRGNVRYDDVLTVGENFQIRHFRGRDYLEPFDGSNTLIVFIMEVDKS